MIVIRQRSLAFAVAACIGLLLAGCGPSGNDHGGHGGHAMFGMHRGMLPLLHHGLRMGMRGMRLRGMRRACADDIARLCPNKPSRRDERECLESKRESLNADCREALDARRNRNRDTGLQR